jgi:hypothetical protein
MHALWMRISIEETRRCTSANKGPRSTSWEYSSNTIWRILNIYNRRKIPCLITAQMKNQKILKINLPFRQMMKIC